MHCASANDLIIEVAPVCITSNLTFRSLNILSPLKLHHARTKHSDLKHGSNFNLTFLWQEQPHYQSRIAYPSLSADNSTFQTI